MTYLYVIAGTGRCRYTLKKEHISGLMDDDFCIVSSEMIWADCEDATVVYHIQYWSTGAGHYNHVFCFDKNRLQEAVEMYIHEDDFTIDTAYLE
jgi:hypothetical protein